MPKRVSYLLWILFAMVLTLAALWAPTLLEWDTQRLSESAWVLGVLTVFYLLHSPTPDNEDD